MIPVTFPDPEKTVRAYLADQLSTLEPDVTVGVGVPADWAPATSKPHIQVACDGVPSNEYPVLAHATIRLVARASSTSEAKRLAAFAQGVLCAHPGDGSVVAARMFTGVLPARDPVTRAELAATTTRVTFRSIPIT